MSPEKTFRIGYVSASVFRNTVKKDGVTRAFRNVSLQRRYKDGDEWKHSTSFGLADLPNALECLRLALSYVAEQEAEISS